jgi:hypothetical protein
MSYYPLKDVEVDLHYRTREDAKRIVIETIKDCHSRQISCVKFITGRGNHINSTGGRGVLYETFPSWMIDTKIKHLIEHSQRFDGYYFTETFNFPEYGRHIIDRCHLCIKHIMVFAILLIYY